ncbi:hypothetical protein K2173_018168 [Erythroxylum novogranatense]|uniref:Flavin-containing monooxygenase n=1 Tax=Erythroxylum novogranatense TaxID=1862640 RepID=A0AAV8TNS2_9ROSI|nr:hypothetical protein K2173_018168 [Erythroxylum novogranatense]
MPSSENSVNILHVAVIGAGASGLLTARELRREGHKVVVFDKGDEVGGTWVYTTQVETDLLGLDQNRDTVHSSAYESLRTNLPREAMSFRDFPFVPLRDPRRHPDRREVLMYLQEFAREFDIEELVRFGTEVVSVEQVVDGGKLWNVKSKRKGLDGDGGCIEDNVTFDAVVICCGNFSEPRIAQFAGFNSWPGKQMHSHNYRTPEAFKDQVIVLIGLSSSAKDLSIEISEVAKEVHIAARSVSDDTCEKMPGKDNIWINSMIESAHEDGKVVFRNGAAIFVDTIIHCTGYKYHYPFLKTNGIVTVDDNRVGPLYKHVFPPRLAPWLSFVGIPLKANAFPAFELQSKWVAAVLSNRVVLPSQEDMMEDVNTFYSMLEASGVPKCYTHSADAKPDYCNWLAAQCRCPGFEEWRVKIYQEALKNASIRPCSYRDEWEDEHLILQAREDFSKYTSFKSWQY